MKKRLLNELKNKKVFVYINTILQILDMILLIIIIGFFAYILNKTLVEKTNIKTYLYLFIICLIVIKAINIYIIQRLTNYISKLFVINLRTSIYQKLTKISEKDYEVLSSTNFLILYNDGVMKLANFVSKSISLNNANISNIFIFVLTVGIINYKLGLVVLLGAILIPIGMNVVRKAAQKIVADKWKSYVNLSENFMDNLNGLQTLKIYQSDEYKNNEMNLLAEDFRVKTMKSLAIRLHSITIMEIVTYVGMGLSIIFAIIFNLNNEINSLETIFMILISFVLFIPARGLGTYAHSYRSAKMLSKRIYKIIDLKDEKIKNIYLNEKISKVEFIDVFAGYEKEIDVLKNINMKFTDNGLYGILGISGSGKSSALKTLLQRLEYKGEILINGIDIKTLNVIELNERIISVSSSDFLFKATIKENLLYAKANATDEELIKTLEKVKLDFPLDLKIDSNGSNISVGQRQRLILARALLYDADLYLLDEILSGVDYDNEKIIMNVINELAKTKIVICITHRLTSIENAKHIYYLSDGNIKESGTHLELYNSRQEYYQLYLVQNHYVTYGGNENENI
ncbi:ATP-binding cassette domain-containing protein [Haploplasma axanthum]|uniref:ABC-type multidrug/protein/lipid transport system ATPase component n=1 Tax=Haploplasma axanthum TaxID=29552 RepID=A0A449BFH4_HAPAX|nr:ATP-binding cassette domain-containing protein [Haploplasma axanthum]VEU81194.1 ABC-type multidrug/protein/lipid transport system ATPase component [Haploplasma axanthum]